MKLNHSQIRSFRFGFCRKTFFCFPADESMWDDNKPGSTGYFYVMIFIYNMFAYYVIIAT